MKRLETCRNDNGNGNGNGTGTGRRRLVSGRGTDVGGGEKRNEQCNRLRSGRV